MFAPRPLLPLLLLGAACLTASSPAAARQRRLAFTTLPGGLPLSAVFTLCEVNDQSDGIGPCLADLLRGAIDTVRPNLTTCTGLQIGRDDIVLEPLKFKDIKPKNDESVQMSVKNLFLHGISTLDINDFTFNSNKLALNLSFTNVTATGNVKLSLPHMWASSQMTLELSNLTVLAHTNIELALNPADPSRFHLVLNNATVKFELSNFNIFLQDLGSVGILLQNFINANSKTLMNFLVPGLERSLSEELNNSKLCHIKLSD